MANAVMVLDANGDAIDAVFYCSDSHAKTHPNYDGWNGCHELGHGQPCAFDGCPNWCHGVDDCECETAYCVAAQKGN